jgi:hypothetical protein
VGWVSREGGQATVELVAALPAIFAAGLIALQLGLAGYTLTLADGAAEAGALALSAGQPVQPAVRAALPGWSEEAAEVSARGGRITFTRRPLSPLPFVAERLAATSTAFARRPAP